MEMDRQTLMVLFGAIITLTLIGTHYLAKPKPAAEGPRPVYAEGDIRHKLQTEEAKQNSKAKKRPPAQESTSSTSSDEPSENEEPPAEEPSID